MGDVIGLRPVGETLEFGEQAAIRRDVIVGAMLKAIKRLQDASPPYGEGQVEATNIEIMELQKDRARADDLVKTMGDACDAVHQQREMLDAKVPDGLPVIVLAANPSLLRVVAFKVERRGHRFFCKNFDIFQVTESGVASMLEYYAAA
jgi:hypothetical protein